MLYSIIPPLLVIFSLVGIILFLMKKAPQVAHLEDEDFKIKKKQKTLREKMKRMIKGIILVIGKIVKIVKEKIKIILTKREKDENKKSDLIKEAEIMRKIKETKQSRQRIENNLKEFFGKKEKVVRPIISEKVVRPRKIEKIMIEKIANNPKDVKAYESLGDYYLEIENWKDAKECFKQAIKLDAQNVNVKIKLRKLERIMGR